MYLFVKFCNMKEILKDYKYLILLWLLTIIGLFFYCGHYSNILIDFGREVYYPEQILQGKVLFKDLFNIYGPLSYQVNALLYKVFGTKLTTLYGAGWICSLLAISGIYLIAQKFLSKFASFCIGFFTICVCVTTTSIFSFHFPYSWAILYGLISFLYSLYFLLNYLDDKKDLNLCISSFLAGCCITNKYDFILYAFVILYFIVKEKNWKAFLSFISAPLISYGILFIQGMKFSELFKELQIVGAMSKTKTLTYFYQNVGVYFHYKAIITDIVLFIKNAIPFGLIAYGVLLFEKNKLGSFIVSIIGYFLLIVLFSANMVASFGFLPVLLFILTIVCFKKLDIKQKTLIIASILVSAKVFWLLHLIFYGNYYVSVILISIFVLLLTLLPKNLEKVMSIYLLITAFSFLFGNIYSYKNTLGNKVETNRGFVYVDNLYYKSTNDLLNFIKNKTKPSDRVVIFPEGMMINFLADRKGDDYYNSLIPLYVETFGEDKIIEYYKEKMPEYIVFSNLSMKDYYFQYICNDYALGFCGFVNQNYTQESVIDKDFRYMIFKRK